jgi:hypothetical protein
VLSVLAFGILVVVCWLNVRVFHSSQRCSGSRSVFVPNLLVFQLLLSLLLLGLLSLPGNKDLLIIWRFKRRPLVLVLHKGISCVLSRH